MYWSDWPKRTAHRCWITIGGWCMPWWKKVALPEDMTRPDGRTEKVIDRLETVAERMEAVAKVLSDDLDKADEEQHQLQRIVREAQGRPRRSFKSDRGDYTEGRTDDGGSDD